MNKSFNGEENSHYLPPINRNESANLNHKGTLPPQLRKIPIPQLNQPSGEPNNYPRCPQTNCHLIPPKR